jgi:ethanolamine utilization protein EutA
MTASGDRPGGKPHTLTDHGLGDFYPHEHGPDADHDHDVIDPGPLEENPIWQQDNVFLRSVGIDVGSAGTQVVFSGVHMRRHGEDLTSRYVVVARETLYESPVELTPYADGHRIDAAALGTIIDDAYAAAGIAPGAVDTGVVILTGEALRRENAEGIAAILAEKGGEFVTATAGNHMEAMLAAYGSGAAAASFETGKRILNIDIGGGTTKLAIVEKGRVMETAAIHIGGRLIVVEDGRVARLDPAGAHHAERAGFRCRVGSEAGDDDLPKNASGMAALLEAVLGPEPPADALVLYLTDPPKSLGGIDGIMVSGGVGEYVYERETRDFGDLGRHLGWALREKAEAGALGAPLLPAGACIRATALGASEYSVQLSGSTGCITRPGKLLPRRNLQVVKPDIDLSGEIDPRAVADAIGQHLVAFDLDQTDESVLAFQWFGQPEYQRIRAFADGIASGMAGWIAAGKPLYLMLDGDIAQTLGAILRDEIKVGVEMLVIDGILLRDFDYIDLGRIRVPSLTVPVTIKSLIFREQSGEARRPERIHHRHPHYRRHHHGHHQHGNHHHHHGHDHPRRDHPGDE